MGKLPGPDDALTRAIHAAINRSRPPAILSYDDSGGGCVAVQRLLSASVLYDEQNQVGAWLRRFTIALLEELLLKGRF